MRQLLVFADGAAHAHRVAHVGGADPGVGGVVVNEQALGRGAVGILVSGLLLNKEAAQARHERGDDAFDGHCLAQLGSGSACALDGRDLGRAIAGCHGQGRNASWRADVGGIGRLGQAAINTHLRGAVSWRAQRGAVPDGRHAVGTHGAAKGRARMHSGHEGDTLGASRQPNGAAVGGELGGSGVVERCHHRAGVVKEHHRVAAAQTGALRGDHLDAVGQPPSGLESGQGARCGRGNHQSAACRYADIGNCHAIGKRGRVVVPFPAFQRHSRIAVVQDLKKVSWPGVGIEFCDQQPRGRSRHRKAQRLGASQACKVVASQVVDHACSHLHRVARTGAQVGAGVDRDQPGREADLGCVGDRNRAGVAGIGRIDQHDVARAGLDRLTQAQDDVGTRQGGRRACHWHGTGQGGCGRVGGLRRSNQAGRADVGCRCGLREAAELADDRRPVSRRLHRHTVPHRRGGGRAAEGGASVAGGDRCRHPG